MIQSELILSICRAETLRLYQTLIQFLNQLQSLLLICYMKVIFIATYVKHQLSVCHLHQVEQVLLKTQDDREIDCLQRQ